MAKYLIWAAEGIYQGLHGIYNMDVIEGTYDEAADTAREMSYEVMESYSDVENTLMADAQEWVDAGDYDNIEDAYAEAAENNLEYTWCQLNDSHTLEEYRAMTGELEYEEIFEKYGVEGTN